MKQARFSFPGASRLMVLVVLFTACLAVGNRVSAQAASDGANDIMLTAGISGRVAEVRVSVGDQVSAGDVLLVMDTTAMQARLDATRAQLAYARQKYQLEKDDYVRQEELYNEGSMSTVELQMEQLEVTEAAAELAQARAAVTIAEWQLQQSELVAPASGEITLIAYPGQFVNAENGVPIMRIRP